MTHFGILCLAATGHLNTVLPLGRELQQRGHDITVFSALEAQARAQAAGFNFCDIYALLPRVNSRSSSTTPRRFANLTGIQRTFQNFARLAEARLQNVDMIRAQGIEALLVDLSVFEGGTIAEYLNIPYITICSILPFYQDPLIPPIATTWQYETSGWAQLRNRVAYSLFERIAQSVWQTIAVYRQQWNLPAYKHTNDIFSSLAIITRHIPEFEFPRQLPSHFHYTGPFHQAIECQSVDFPFEWLSDQPLIYASMGTVQNRSSFIFQTIAAACANLDAQLVISLGNGLEPATLPNLPGKPLVVKYAPQLELLQRARLNITHAGLNTALESLSYGVPMVAIPITDDQPGVAARIVWTRTGELINPNRLNVSRLNKIIQRILSEHSYKQNVDRLQKAIYTTQGVSLAADIVEQAALTKRPVVR